MVGIAEVIRGVAVNVRFDGDVQGLHPCSVAVAELRERRQSRRRDISKGRGCGDE